MKKIYKIGTEQDFTYTIPAFFKKNVKVENHWVVRNVKYIYAENQDEAVEKYKNWFFKQHKGITYGWSDWYSRSKGANVMMDEKLIDIISTQIVVSDDNIDINYTELKENMQAEDFREWWFDDGSHNWIPE